MTRRPSPPRFPRRIFDGDGPPVSGGRVGCVVGDEERGGVVGEGDVTGGGEVRGVVMGIGCNVRWAGFPDELEKTATACDREAGRPVDRSALLDTFLAALASRLDALD